MLASVPWWVLMLIEGHLALFIVSYAIASTYDISGTYLFVIGIQANPVYQILFSAFFTVGLISPITAELAAVSRSIEGVGCTFQKNVFQLFL
jgi:hypothetical protein